MKLQQIKEIWDSGIPVYLAWVTIGLRTKDPIQVRKLSSKYHSRFVQDWRNADDKLPDIDKITVILQRE